jgi:hypothetical protein
LLQCFFEGFVLDEDAGVVYQYVQTTVVAFDFLGRGRYGFFVGDV